MDIYNGLMSIFQTAITVYGGYHVVWGMITIGGGLKDKTGPQIQQGFGELVGGAIIILAAVFIGNLTLG